jgi:hypothetical protein
MFFIQIGFLSLNVDGLQCYFAYSESGTTYGTNTTCASGEVYCMVSLILKYLIKHSLYLKD